MTEPTFRSKRVYDPPAPDDGFRVLVDRLWPRGITRERAALDLWLEDAAPSPALRTEWHHDPQRLDEFAARYRPELDPTRPSTSCSPSPARTGR